MKRRITYLIVWVAVLLYLGNPDEPQFLNAVSEDFGNLHGGMEITPESLIEMGQRNYQSYWLFSQYSYRFGDIRVHYLGIGFMTYYQGSERIKNENTLTI